MEDTVNKLEAMVIAKYTVYKFYRAVIYVS